MTVSDGTATTTGPTWTFHTVASTDPVFVGVGDIASAPSPRTRPPATSSPGSTATSGRPATTSTTTARRAEFTNCYATTPWGDAAASRPAPARSPATTTGALGDTDNLAGYIGYFGAAATDANGKSYYSYDIPASNWHIVNLDTECAAGARRLRRRLPAGAVAEGRPRRAQHQERHRPVAQARATAPAPRRRPALQPFWDDLYAAGVDILLDGHDHIYERTAPHEAGATLASPPVADPTYGITQFTVGTGGEGHHGLATTLPTSQVRNDTTFGIMKFTLHATSYDWVFLPIAGSTFTDSGTRSVHGAPPPPTTIGFRSAASAANATTTTLVLPRPAGTVSGDELLASVSVRGTPTITPPAGWALVRRDERNTTFTQATYVHPAGGSEPTSYTFTFDASETAVGAIAAYTGVDGANPTAGDSGQANSGSTSITAPSVSAAVPGTRLVGLFGITGNTTITPPTSMTERSEIVSPVTSKLTLSLDDQSNAASGATGTRVATAAASGNSIGQLVALRPGTGGPPPNTPPTASAVSVTTPQNTAVGVTLAGSDPETCELTFSVVTGPAHGSLGSIGAVACVAGSPNHDTASVQYTPTNGYSGPDSFTYRVSDGTDFSTAATVTITVSPPANTIPSAADLSLSTAQDTPLTVTLAATDIETCDLTFSIVSAPTHGGLGAIGPFACAVGSPNNDTASVVYTPTSGYTGSDSFTYRVFDGTDFSAAATVSLTISAPGSGIAFRAAAAGTNTGATSLLISRPVAAVAGDVLVAAITVRSTPIITPPAGWSLVRSDARVSTFSQAVYVHVAGGSEPASYTWTFSTSQTALGTIAAFSGVDTANPIVANSGLATSSSTAITAPSLTVGVADTRLVGFFGIVGKTTISPAAGMTERIESVSPAGASAKMTVELADQPNPASGSTGTRTATGAKSAHNIGQLIALRAGGGGPPANTIPSAADLSLSTAQDTPLTVTLAATDIETCDLTFSIVSAPTHGGLGAIGPFACAVGSPNNDTASVVYTPTSGYTGSDSFTYRVFDGTDFSAAATVSLTISAPGSGIAFRAAAAGTNTGATSLLISRPVAAVAGDVLVAAITVRSTPIITPPAGWSLVRSDARVSTFSQAVYVHVAGGSEPASYTWTFSTSQTALGTIAAFSGVDTANPIVANSGLATSSSTAITAPSLTVGVADTRLVGFFGIVGKTTISPAAGMTERIESVSPAGASAKMTVELADQPNPASGSTGTRTATGAKSAHNIGQLIALRAAP